MMRNLYLTSIILFLAAFTTTSCGSGMAGLIAKTNRNLVKSLNLIGSYSFNGDVTDSSILANNGVLFGGTKFSLDRYGDNLKGVKFDESKI